MICAKCGAQIADSSDVFCVECGAPVNQAPPPPIPVPQAAQQTAPPTEQPIYPPSQPPARTGKKRLVLPVILVVLLVAAAAFSVWYFILRDKSSGGDGTSAGTGSAFDIDEDDGDAPSRPPREEIEQRGERPPRPDGNSLPELLRQGLEALTPGDADSSATAEPSPTNEYDVLPTMPAPEPESVPEPEPEWYPPPAFETIMASNVTDSPTGREYGPEQTRDGLPETAWNVPESSDEWIMLLDNTEQYVSGLRILNGYTKYSPEYDTWLYYRNHRPKDIVIFFSDGSYLEWTLSDVFDEDNYIYQDITFDTPMLTSYLMIYIVDFYEGDRWDDICISEIEVY